MLRVIKSSTFCGWERLLLPIHPLPSPIHPPEKLSPQYLQGFLHNKTSPHLEVTLLSQRLIGKQWEGDKPLPCTDPKLLCGLPTHYTAEEVPKIPRSSAVSKEGVSKDPPEGSLLSETGDSPAAFPVSAEIQALVRTHGSVARSPWHTKHGEDESATPAPMPAVGTIYRRSPGLSPVEAGLTGRGGSGSAGVGLVMGGSQWGEASPVSSCPGQHGTRARARMQNREEHRRRSSLCPMPWKNLLSLARHLRTPAVLTAQFSLPKDTESAMVLWLLRGVVLSLQRP